MGEPRHVLITGASSGIGAALALAYAGPGTRLALAGRDRARLDRVASACLGRGAEVSAATVEVTDAAAMAAWIAAEDDTRALDLVVANAGISAHESQGPTAVEAIRAMVAINIGGVFNTVQPAIGRMHTRGRGQIAIMSSLASFRGLAFAPSYCATKAAVRVYGEGLRVSLAPSGIGVSVICPGFVRSGMTAGNTFAMPLLMDADRAARIIQRGLERNRGRIAFPRRLYAGIWLIAALPPWLAERLDRSPRAQPAGAK